ncbi:hypothetical protein VTN31DRAFT_3667 [Thermomyces dupontii]|uniref:uncharacterized protein n=1 Tax=Talaromyces thermophilus TaxID=28565 RepID=UPI003742D8CF
MGRETSDSAASCFPFVYQRPRSLAVILTKRRNARVNRVRPWAEDGPTRTLTTIGNQPARSVRFPLFLILLSAPVSVTRSPLQRSRAPWCRQEVSWPNLRMRPRRNPRSASSSPNSSASIMSAAGSTRRSTSFSSGLFILGQLQGFERESL